MDLLPSPPPPWIHGPVDVDQFIRAAMAWHFDRATGSPFWLERAARLDFDPLTDITTWEDLRRFPNVTDELRDVAAADLIPRGYGSRTDVLGIIESGGSTGAPKRLPLLADFADLMAQTEAEELRRLGDDGKGGWLVLFPSGPHGALEQIKRTARKFAGAALVFAVDLDPRWVRKQTDAHHGDIVESYIDHVLDQAASILQVERITSLRITPPLLERLAARKDLVDLVRSSVRLIVWGGAPMDPDSRDYYRSVVFPEATLLGRYGTTMALGAGAAERADEPDRFDPTLSPYVSLQVVQSTDGEPATFGERGRLIVHHVSPAFLLPNNAERDSAVRIHPVHDQAGDSIAEIRPLETFDGRPVTVGVY